MASPNKPADACTIVIFGATGDLTNRLLMPALYNLRHSKLLPENFALIGTGRGKKTDASFREELHASLQKFATTALNESDWAWFASRIYYVQGDFEDQHLYQRVATRIKEAGEKHKTDGNVLFYLATPPEAFIPIVSNLGSAGLAQETNESWRRVIIEKPFGHDYRSAHELNREILSVLKESQIFRIDHYLGKETVQNILIFRFANGIFEPLWNRDHIDHVQITVAETVGVEGRGKFYDATGALRDMVPNHLSQLLTLTAMEPPALFDAEALRTEKAKVLDAVRRLDLEDVGRDVVRGQYAAGDVNGEAIESYRASANVPKDSTTETYVAMKLLIDNWRWAGVPFYLRTGKALTKRRSEVAIQFKQAPLALFRDTPLQRLPPNDLVLKIQPEEGVTLRLSAKVPGPRIRMGGVEMKFNYSDYFNAPAKTGYETLIYDCMNGDQMLYQRADNIEAAWRMVQPILDAWEQEGATHLPHYTAGSAGPEESDALLARDGRRWRPLTRETITP